MTGFPYRESARVIPAAPHRRRWASAVVGGFVAIAVSWLAWSRIEETTTFELRTSKEVLPAHSPIVAIWSNDEGTRAFAVGSGDVLIHTSELGEKGTWRRVDLAFDGLRAVGGGDGPILPGPYVIPGRPLRVFAVGARGVLVDCHDDACHRSPSGVTQDLSAVAVAGGQAFAVGSAATILHITGDGVEWREAAKRREAQDPYWLRVTPVQVKGLDPIDQSDLTDVALACAPKYDCAAVAVGAPGLIVEGVGYGGCDEGGTSRGSPSVCNWSWSVRRFPTGPALEKVFHDGSSFVAYSRDGKRVRRTGAFSWLHPGEGDWVEDGTLGASGMVYYGEVRAPVHVIERKLWRKRETSLEASLVLATVLQRRTGRTLTPLPTDVRFVAGGPSLGANPFLVSDQGEVFRVR